MAYRGESRPRWISLFTPTIRLTETALRFALASPDLSGVVFGLATLDHLEQALGAAEMGPLPAAALAALDEVYAAGFGD